MSNCNNFWCTYYSDNKSSKDSFIFPTASCLCNFRTLENTEHENSHISQYAARYFARNKNWITFFTPTFLQLFGCSKCRPYARMHALSLFIQSLTAKTFCCRPFQTSIRRCFSLSTLFIQHSPSHCCMIPYYISYIRRC